MLRPDLTCNNNFIMLLNLNNLLQFCNFLKPEQFITVLYVLDWMLGVKNGINSKIKLDETPSFIDNRIRLHLHNHSTDLKHDGYALHLYYSYNRNAPCYFYFIISNDSIYG